MRSLCVDPILNGLYTLTCLIFTRVLCRGHYYYIPYDRTEAQESKWLAMVAHLVSAQAGCNSGGLAAISMSQIFSPLLLLWKSQVQSHLPYSEFYSFICKTMGAIGFIRDMQIHTFKWAFFTE